MQIIDSDTTRSKAVSIIIPLYNEEENVALLHEQIQQLVKFWFAGFVGVVFVEMKTYHNKCANMQMCKPAYWVLMVEIEIHL